MDLQQILMDQVTWSPSTTIESCTWGAPVDGKFIFDVPGLTARECATFRIITAYIMFWNSEDEDDSILVDQIHRLGVGAQLATAWPTYAEVVSGEECPALVGDPLLGAGCPPCYNSVNTKDLNAQPGTAFGFQAAFCAGGIVPETVSVTIFCDDNSYVIKTIFAKMDPDSNP